MIVESSAHCNLGNDLSTLAKDGVVAVVGSRGEPTVNSWDLMATVSSVIGVMLSGASAADLEEVHAAIDAGLATGRLRPHVAVKSRGLASAALAHEEVISHASTGGSARGKICIATQDDEYISIQFVPRLTHPLANTRSPVAAVDRRTTQCL